MWWLQISLKKRIKFTIKYTVVVESLHTFINHISPESQKFPQLSEWNTYYTQITVTFVSVMNLQSLYWKYEQMCWDKPYIHFSMEECSVVRWHNPELFCWQCNWCCKQTKWNNEAGWLWGNPQAINQKVSGNIWCFVLNTSKWINQVKVPITFPKSRSLLRICPVCLRESVSGSQQI